MKPIKSAEKFQALLDRAYAKHEKQKLSQVSLEILEDL